MTKNSLMIIFITIILVTFVWKISEQQKTLTNAVENMKVNVDRLNNVVNNALTSKQMSGHLITVRGKLNSNEVKLIKILELLSKEGLQK